MAAVPPVSCWYVSILRDSSSESAASVTCTAGWQHLCGRRPGVLPQRLVPGRPRATPCSAPHPTAPRCLPGALFEADLE